jgi:hypothetical protein
MAEEKRQSLQEMIADSALMTEAIRKGVREELLSHARAGNSVPVSENGQIVWLSPDEIYRRLGYAVPERLQPVESRDIHQTSPTS